MSLSSSVLASLIQSNLVAQGAKGSNLQKFCTAVATGIVISVVGKSFVTVDTGTITGTGTGTGTGIQSLSSPSMKSIALSLMNTKGKNADKLMTAIMDATVSHLSSSTSLTTVDAPVYIGVGVITVGSITVSSSEMSSNIDSQLQAVGAKGKNRTKLSTAIGTGICTNIISSGTGTLVIVGTGVPSGPGVGAGVGTLS